MGGLDKIYYSLDGSDPKYGELYSEPIIILESTTVCAKSNFLWLWSDVSTVTYNKQNENKSGKLDITSDIEEDAADILDIKDIPILDDESNIDINELASTDENINEPTRTDIIEGINPTEGYNLRNFINQYRTDNNIETLAWDSELCQVAELLAVEYANGEPMIDLLFYNNVNRRCNLSFPIFSDTGFVLKK